MSLIKSISGIRGTIGGRPGENFTPIDIVECAAGFAQWLIESNKARKIIIGRDGRVTGKWVQDLVTNTLISQGIDVVDLGLSTTPTVEMMVPKLGAGAGIIITASHNPKEWNALKFLNDKGEFISASDGQQILNYIADSNLNFCSLKEFGTYETYQRAMEDHVASILKLNLVNVRKIQNAKLKVVVDCINSTGALAMPVLLKALNVEFELINEQITGDFAHNPEPLPQNLKELSLAVLNANADFGIAVDPDVDRLALVSEDGNFFGEEYTLVAVADYILKYKKGATVSNLSSSRALADISNKHACLHFAAAVGEVNVVQEMKLRNAVIGGEGNGGIIYPELHYGRDALVGVAFILSLLTETNLKLSELKAQYPSYVIIKDKIQLEPNIDLDSIFDILMKKFQNEKFSKVDGLKIDFSEGWVHMRKSNTEPIIRIYAEARTEKKAKMFINMVKSEIPLENL